MADGEVHLEHAFYPSWNTSVFLNIFLHARWTRARKQSPAVYHMATRISGQESGRTVCFEDALYAIRQQNWQDIIRLACMTKESKRRSEMDPRRNRTFIWKAFFEGGCVF